MNKQVNNKSVGADKKINIILLIFLLIVILVLMILIFTKKDSSNDNNGKNRSNTGQKEALASTTLDGVKTSGVDFQLHTNYAAIKLKETDTLADIVRSKNNLYGFKIGLKGTIENPYCKNTSSTYEFTDIDTLDAKFLLDGSTTSEIYISEPTKNLINAYYLGEGGCNSSYSDMVILQYPDRLLIYDKNYNSGVIVTNLDFDMFYTLNVDTSIGDYAENESVTSYLIGKTKTNQMYIFNEVGEPLLIDKNVNFKVSNKYAGTDYEDNMIIYTVYGAKISYQDGTITGFPDIF